VSQFSGSWLIGCNLLLPLGTLKRGYLPMQYALITGLSGGRLIQHSSELNDAY